MVQNDPSMLIDPFTMTTPDLRIPLYKEPQLTTATFRDPTLDMEALCPGWRGVWEQWKSMSFDIIIEQECVPVQCVPPALYRTRGLCLGWGVSLSRGREGLCPAGSLWEVSVRGVSVQGSLSGRPLVEGTWDQRQRPLRWNMGPQT